MKRSALLLLLACARLTCAQDSFQPEKALVFEGNRVFSQDELLNVTDKCLVNAQSKDAYIDHCLWKLKSFLGSKGYLQVNIGTPRVEKSNQGPKLIVPIDEGPLFRLGKIQIEGSKLFSSSRMLEMLALRPGDAADSECLSVWAYQDLAALYGNLGFIRYTAELQPTYHIEQRARVGTVDFRVAIDEGPQFTIGSVKFAGLGGIAEADLLKEMLVRKGDVFNRQLFEESLKKIGHTERFERIDADKDVDYKWDNKNPVLDIVIHMKKKIS